MFCAVCQAFVDVRFLLPSLCNTCEDEINQLASGRIETFGKQQVRVLFRYEGIIQELVTRAKVKNDAVAAGYLCRAAKRVLDNQLRSPWSLVIPAPPSFWGRIRGRFDLAELLALLVCDQDKVFTGLVTGLPLGQKRAGRNLDAPNHSMLRGFTNSYYYNSNALMRIKEHISSDSRIVVVDDVMTTGLTMRTIFNQLMELGAQSVEGLVMASSS
jgi:predicted amidophosphoribosyltransferase